jgi:hypothetical protein
MAVLVSHYEFGMFVCKNNLAFNSFVCFQIKLILIKNSHFQFRA